jgi:hypothetical protein
MKLLPIAPVLLGLCALPGQQLPNQQLPNQELPQWVLSLSRIKRQTRAELLRIPNYACLETIKRFHKPARGTVFKLTDTLRIEVALIGDRELFAPEGATQFQDVDLSSLFTGGTIGTGAFTSIVRNLFVGDAGRTTGWGEETLNGQRALWYSFAIPEMFKAYKVTSPTGSAYVAEDGKFWVDAQTLVLLRIEEHALDIPYSIGMREISNTIDYAKLPIGESLQLLPRTAETLVTESDGSQNRNITEFSNCREYSSQSLIRFGPDDPDPQPPAAPKKK